MRRTAGQEAQGRATALGQTQAALNLFNNSNTNEFRWRRFLRKADFGNRGDSGSLGTMGPVSEVRFLGLAVSRQRSPSCLQLESSYRHLSVLYLHFCVLLRGKMIIYM